MVCMCACTREGGEGEGVQAHDRSRHDVGVLCCGCSTVHATRHPFPCRALPRLLRPELHVKCRELD